MVLSLQVICGKKFTFNGKEYNQVEVSALGKGSFKLTLPEKLVPDFFEGRKFKLNFGIDIKGGKLVPVPMWESLEFDDEIEN